MATTRTSDDVASDKQQARIVMGACWTAMGGACVVAPELLLQMSFHKRFLPPDGTDQARLAKLLMQCFGAQACCCGLLMLLNPMTKTSGLAWAGAMVPFFIFDFVYWRDGMLSDFGAIGDAVGNVVFAACSLSIADVL